MNPRTKYEIGAVPHSQHPRPQMRRENWLCLNGEWTLCKKGIDGKELYVGSITVPFSPETVNSGVEAGFALGPGERLYYRRTVMLDESLLRGITHLHFDAVDSACEVFVNGASLATHRGGFTAFVADISSVARLGENEIEVICTDEATRNSGARGKQSDRRGGIWYTAQSGIWQTVWLEYMPKDEIKDLRITPKEGGKEVLVEAKSESEITKTRRSIRIRDFFI